MILFHFTSAANVLGILERGLIPNVPDPDFMTIGEPVVWLTSAETMKATEEDLAWIEARRGTTFSDHEAAEFAKAIVFGRDTTRLTIRLEPNSKRLALWSRTVSGKRHGPEQASRSPTPMRGPTGRTSVTSSSASGASRRGSAGSLTAAILSPVTVSTIQPIPIFRHACESRLPRTAARPQAAAS
jgi:hypothetical protein